jgi:hypothetical protein
MLHEKLDYHTIMSNISLSDQLLVWSWILNQHVSLGQVFTNPFRYDPKPGCFLREYNRLILLTDYSNPEYSKYTVCHAVRDLMHCTLTQAAVNIYAALFFNKPLQFNVSTITGTRLKGRKSGINIHFCPWTKEGKPTYTKWDEEYWADTEVTFEDLKRNDIFSINHFFLNDKMIMPEYPTYGYYRANTGHVKIPQT